MSDRLIPILNDKRRHVAECKARLPLSELQRRTNDMPPARGFRHALESQSGYALITEIKQASPSRGLIRADFDPPALARAYRDGGAACLSVLTDTPYFQGRDEHLVAVRAAVDLPILRKDFIVDAYQIIESRALGADCILLIMAALGDAEATEFLHCAENQGLDALVEVHDGAELDRALALNAGMIGINNRNLKSLTVDLKTSLLLSPRIPQGVTKVAESGLSGATELALLATKGINAFLIGESLLRQNDVETATRALLDTKPELK